MLSFYPEFEACETDDVDVVLLLDMSNSMKGDALRDAKKLMLLCFSQLPDGSYFNVVVFGTGDINFIFIMSLGKYVHTNL